MTVERALAVGLAALVATGTASLGAGSCSRLSPERSGAEAGQSLAAPAPSGPPLVHPKGLVLGAQPPEYRVRQTDTGFRIEPASARRMRNPWLVELRLVPTDPLTGSDLKSKKVGDRDAHYRLSVDAENAGSGGPLHTLTASIACPSGRIAMTATQQAEPPDTPDWSAAWTILASSRCPSDRRAVPP